jgi:enoyl-CoA hydratase
MTDTIKTERHGRVAVLTLNRPGHLNAIGTPTITELAGILTGLEGDKDVGAVVITGEEKAFSAGADIGEFSAFQRPAEFADFIHRLTDTYAQLQALPLPSIAAINGVAFGGGLELALACDIRIAATHARLGVPEIKLGLLPGAGGTARLTRMLPPGMAKQLLLTGEPITAADAHRLGLVNEVVEDGSVLDRSLQLAKTMAALPAQALAAAKRLVDQGVDMPLAAAVTLEREIVSTLFATDDRAEGVAAFLEKRPARFQHR